MLATAFPLVGERGEAASDWAFDPTTRTKLGQERSRPLGEQTFAQWGIARDAGICSNLLEAAMEILGGFESQYCHQPCYLDLMATNLFT